MMSKRAIEGQDPDMTESNRQPIYPDYRIQDAHFPNNPYRNPFVGERIVYQPQLAIDPRLTFSGHISHHSFPAQTFNGPWPQQPPSTCTDRSAQTAETQPSTPGDIAVHSPYDLSSGRQSWTSPYQLHRDVRCASTPALESNEQGADLAGVGTANFPVVSQSPAQGFDLYPTAILDDTYNAHGHHNIYKSIPSRFLDGSFIFGGQTEGGGEQRQGFSNHAVFGSMEERSRLPQYFGVNPLPNGRSISENVTGGFATSMASNEDVGCGGARPVEYTEQDFDDSLVDPAFRRQEFVQAGLLETTPNSDGASPAFTHSAPATFANVAAQSTDVTTQPKRSHETVTGKFPKKIHRVAAKKKNFGSARATPAAAKLRCLSKACRERFSTLKERNDHLKACSFNKFKCIFGFAGCNTGFPQKNEWKRHITTTHFCVKIWVCREVDCIKSAKTPEGIMMPTDGHTFNRRDLFVEHFKRVHLMFHRPRKEAERAKLTKDENTALMAAANAAAHDRRQLLREFTCPSPNCADERFSGDKAWNEWLEHIARHMNDAYHKFEPELDFGGEGGRGFIDWAASIGIIRQSQDGTGWKIGDALNTSGQRNWGHGPKAAAAEAAAEAATVAQSDQQEELGDGDEGSDMDAEGELD